jgi:Flp pilus assembly protein TadG
VGTIGESVPRGRSARGQATVELALVLPVVVLALLLVVQLGLVARSQQLVVHAAREGARAEAVGPGSGPAAARATPGLDPGRMRVAVSGGGGAGAVVTVTVTYRARTDVPLVGALLGDPELQGTVRMRVEGPTDP